MKINSTHYFFMALIAVALILSVLIFLPYLSSLLLALVFSILFRPLERWIARTFIKGKEGSGLSSFVTIVIIAVVIITPLLFLFTQVYHEGQNLYYNLTEEGERASIINTLNAVSAWFSGHFFGVGNAMTFDTFNITDYIQNVFQWIFSNFQILFSSATRIILHLVIMLFALFYFLKDGAYLRKQLIILSPLDDTYDEKIITRLDQAIHSVVVGTLLISLIQGFIIGLGFWIFGISNPVLWGSIAMIVSLIPAVGTALVYAPAVLYLFFSGPILPAIGLLVWWIIAVSLIDNYIGPKLINRGIHIHPFLVLLSVIGGIAFFGPIGFIAGPLIIAFLFSLLDVYKTYRTSVQ